MTGVVLCGGQSIRMGSDKGLLLKESVSWAQHAVNVLKETGLKVLISIRKSQLDDYAAVINHHDFITDNDNLEIGGPLKGILSVHLQHPAEDLMVLPCDMPMMVAEVMQFLVTQNKEANKQAIVFLNDEQPETLCAIYAAEGLQKIYKLYTGNKLQRHSMMHILEILHTEYVSVPEDWKPYFANINRPYEHG